MEIFKETMSFYDFPYFDKGDICLKHKIGSGGTGNVYDGTLKLLDSTINCVIKKVSSDNYDENHRDRMIYQDIIDEVNIGHRFMNKSDYQIKFYGYSIFKKCNIITIYLIMEKTEGMDISKYLNYKKYWKKITKEEYDKSSSKTKMYHKTDDKIRYWDYIMSSELKFKIMEKLCLAVQELHSFKIVHGDLKLSNTLYLNDKVKIIDYGASQEMKNEKEIEGAVEMGTPGYMSEDMREGWISYKGDIYSLGVCMLEIWFGDIWCSDTGDYKKCRGYILNYLSLLKKDNLELHNLIKKCISTDPKKRPLTKTILTNLHRIHGEYLDHRDLENHKVHDIHD